MQVTHGRYRPPPTIEEIAQRCIEVQQGWNDKDRAKRAGIHDDPPMTVPVVSSPFSRYPGVLDVEDNDET